MGPNKNNVIVIHTWDEMNNKIDTRHFSMLYQVLDRNEEQKLETFLGIMVKFPIRYHNEATSTYLSSSKYQVNTVSIRYFALIPDLHFPASGTPL